jgi:chaperone required for assembly of F1-ATPase
VKRFYKQVAVMPDGEGFAVKLDGRPIRTPARALLVLPTRALADRIAAEWDAQVGEIRPQAMAMTGLANATIDLMATRRGEIVSDMAGYAATDLLCYRAGAPDALRALQDAGWQPLLDWAASHLGLRFVVTTGIVPVDQELGLVEAARLHIETYDDFTVAGASKLTHGTGSVVLAMAVAEGRITADEAFGLSQIDELWQESLWGADDEAVEFRRALRQDLVDAADFMRLARG